MFVVYFDQRWLLRTLIAGRNSHFQHFLCYKAEKSSKKSSKFGIKLKQKYRVFELAPKRWSSVLFPKKTEIILHSICQYAALGPPAFSVKGWSSSLATLWPHLAHFLLLNATQKFE